MRTCAIEGCGREYRARGWCSMHHKRWLTHGDPLTVGVGGNQGQQTGERNPFWRGDSLSYSGAHMRVRAVRGPAAGHSCDCGRPAAHWAYDHADPHPLTHHDGRVYSADPDHYLPMCVSCHKVFDLAATRSA